MTWRCLVFVVLRKDYLFCFKSNKAARVQGDTSAPFQSFDSRSQSLGSESLDLRRTRADSTMDPAVAVGGEEAAAQIFEAQAAPDPQPALVQVTNNPVHVIAFDRQDWETKELEDSDFSESKRIRHLVPVVYKRLKQAWIKTGYAACRRFLGEGSFGSVYLGFKVKEASLPLQERQLLAIKQCVNSRDAPSAQQEQRQQEQPFADCLARRSIQREVTVLRIDGATLVVRPLPRIDWEADGA